MSDTKQDFTAANGTGNAPQTPAPSGRDDSRDAWGRDTSQWIEVGGKLKPHP